jgi:hypothetical protein
MSGAYLHDQFVPSEQESIGRLAVSYVAVRLLILDRSGP